MRPIREATDECQNNRGFFYHQISTNLEADDRVIEPVSPHERLARIRACHGGAGGLHPT
jgi:hypothetical protein